VGEIIAQEILRFLALFARPQGLRVQIVEYFAYFPALAPCPFLGLFMRRKIGGCDIVPAVVVYLADLLFGEIVKKFERATLVALVGY